MTLKKVKKILAEEERLRQRIADEKGCDIKDVQILHKNKMSSEDRLREIILNALTVNSKPLEDKLMQWHKAEMKKLVPEEKEIYNKDAIGKCGTHAIASNQNYGYNQCHDKILKAIEEA